MKKYVLLLALAITPVCIFAGNDEQFVMENINGASGKTLEDKLEFCLKDLDETNKKKVCYNLLFQKEYLFLKGQEDCIQGTNITIQSLRKSLVSYLREHASLSFEVNFLNIYEEKYVNAVVVPEHFLELYAGQKTKGLLITESTFYKVDPFYIVFKEMEDKEQAGQMMNYLNGFGIEYKNRVYATRPRFDSSDTFMTYNFPKNILNIIGISVDEMKKYLEAEIS